MSNYLRRHPVSTRSLKKTSEKVKFSKLSMDKEIWMHKLSTRNLYSTTTAFLHRFSYQIVSKLETQKKKRHKNKILV